jgi:uncharacterized membrane protein YheB (UPF0754 family)
LTTRSCSEKTKKSVSKKAPCKKVKITKVAEEVRKRKYTKRAPRPSEKITELTEKGVPETKVQSVDPESKWVIIELHEDTFLEEHSDQIERSIREELGPDTEYFIPIYNEKIQGKNACFVLFEGYIFIQRTDEVIQNIFKLKDELVRGPLCVNDCLRLVTGQRINKFKQEMQDKIRALIPEKGQRVTPKVGVFKNLEGEVLSVDKKKLIALVRFEKPSRIVEAPINIVNLSLLSGGTCSTS